MAKRFIVEDKDIKVIDEEIFEIYGKEVKHIQVLRYNINDEIKINNFICVINKITKNSIVLKKIGSMEKQGEPNIALTLYVALLKNEKLDYAIQKSVELGVKRIVPFISKNVIVKLDDKTKEKRVGKLQIIANEACKQCGRTDTVEVENIVNFNDVIKELESNKINIFAYEKETKSIKNVIEDIKKEYNEINNISCIIGPEGGFDKSEADVLCSIKNVYSISLGERILRADTATQNIISILMYEFDKE